MLTVSALTSVLEERSVIEAAFFAWSLAAALVRPATNLRDAVEQKPFQVQIVRGLHEDHLVFDRRFSEMSSKSFHFGEGAELTAVDVCLRRPRLMRPRPDEADFIRDLDGGSVGISILLCGVACVIADLPRMKRFFGAVMDLSVSNGRKML